MSSYPSNWAELRQQQFELDNYTCKGCGITKAQLAEHGLGHLECHHINEGPPHYAAAYGREIVGVNLATYCNTCHDGITDSVRRQRYRLSKDKKIQLSVSEQQQGTSIRESIDRPAIRITVNDDNPTQSRESASRRIEINLFSQD